VVGLFPLGVDAELDTPVEAFFDFAATGASLRFPKAFFDGAFQ
jgi:hypothetical protein